MNLRISEEVQNALNNNIPVVALESTIIAHGMPYPKNIQTALLVEKTIRDLGCVPATIGVMDGECVVGMSEDEIKEFGQRTDLIKISRRDLPVVLARKLSGDTTVTATMIIAHKAGIKVFVTGGIGGVHKEYNETMDVSADLNELAKTPMIVICAGIKAILDLPKTLEYLETAGVTVLGFKTKELPNFYCRHSGIELEYQVENPAEIASIMKSKEEFGLEGGILVTNPVPGEYEANKLEIDKAIEVSIKEAHEQNIHGKYITPFLLKRVAEITDGDSLEANIALILNNAILGALVAKEYCK